MSWVPEFIAALADNMMPGEAATLLGLFFVIAAALVLPSLKFKSARGFGRRDAEFRRLQDL